MSTKQGFETLATQNGLTDMTLEKNTGVKKPDTGAILYRINVAEAKLGVSRSTIYRLVKIGKRSSGITAASINAMIERNLASG